MRYALIGLMVLGLSACEVPSAPPETPSPGIASASPALSPDVAARNFLAVVDRVEPVAESMCRSRLPRENCDFKVVIDDREGQGINAFQTLDRSGQPILGFTLGLILEARNPDEIAFVMGHEAAHHIEKHIPQTQSQAQAGAIAGALLGAIIGGGDPTAIDQGLQLGSFVGARRFSQDHELEADALGTIIAARAGYDPVLGSQFFGRIPDPGNQFLGTHPPNAARLATVRNVAAGL
ncbi:MAG: M48 family metallopeptidase [Dinoroseobacter sp.]|nr:M48 family metallopeptidase [Dinoroseobacter sp.]